MRTALPLAGLMLAAVAAPAASLDRATSEERFAAATAGLVPGQPVDCFDRRRETSFVSAGDRLIFRVSRNNLYVNQTRGGCDMMRADETLLTRSPLGRICRGDSARFVDPRTGIQGGACTLGQFVPYTAAK